MAAPSYVYQLLASETLARWGASSPLGSPVTISYKFATSLSSGVSYPNFTQFNDAELTATRAALAYISSLTNITFQETTGAAQLEFGNGDLSGAGGRATYSYSEGSGIQNATVYISNTGQSNLSGSDFVPGSITSNDVGGHGWGTLLHEIGHALGLKHSFQTNIAGDANSIMPANVDDLVHTVMSYTPFQPSNVAVVTGTPENYSYVSSNLSPQGYSLYDIAALQYLYGADTSSAGNQVFTFLPDVPVFRTVYATGPNNTIDCSALTGPNTIDLNPATFSNLSITQPLPFPIGLASAYNGTSALAIAYGATIQNAIGGSGVDTITGNALANTLNGGGGVDTMTGGLGNDTYHVDVPGDVVIEAAGGGAADRVLASATYVLAAGQQVEILATVNAGATTAINLVGNEFAQTITGNAGNNTLDGRGGQDSLSGGLGNDTYILSNGTDTVADSGGTDRIISVISRSLAGNVTIENLVLQGGNLNGTGNGLANTITGTNGDNVFTGGAGIDTLIGGLGNDTYVLAGDADAINDAGGFDTVSATATRSLAGYSTAERLVLAGAADINGTGNPLNNGLYGNSGRNSLSGAGGVDTLVGGLGRDVLTGGAGKDFFDFNAVAETGTNANTRDAVTDFAQGQDKLDLATIDANGAIAGDPPFDFRGTGAFTAAGQIRYSQIDNPTGADFTIIEGNIDANLAADFLIQLTGLFNLAATDFNL